MAVDPAYPGADGGPYRLLGFMAKDQYGTSQSVEPSCRPLDCTRRSLRWSANVGPDVRLLGSLAH